MIFISIAVLAYRVIGYRKYLARRGRDEGATRIRAGSAEWRIPFRLRLRTQKPELLQLLVKTAAIKEASSTAGGDGGFNLFGQNLARILFARRYIG